MTYDEYEKALNKLLDVQSLFRRVAMETKGQKSDRAQEGYKIIYETRDILYDLYEGVFDDED